MTNIFNKPLNYISEITNNLTIPIENRKKFEGKSMAFVFLTKFCDVECAHCFFRSKKRKKVENLENYELSSEGLDKLIHFLNDSNNGYLSILGGGEPFNRFDYIKKILEKVKTSNIILVTSGFWAKEYKEAEKIIHEMIEILNKRKDDINVVLRISVDKWHRNKISEHTISNIIKIMKKNSKNKKIKLQIHGIEGDDTLEKTLYYYGNFHKENIRNLVSDNDKILKIGYKRYDAIFEDGFKIEIGTAQKFYSNLKVNLNNKQQNLDEIIKIFENDIEFNCFGNPSLVKNSNNLFGLDFLISYNGNVSTWCNEQTYNLNNIYVHNYKQVIDRTFKNIISYSFIDKGYKYREKIFQEVNPLAVLRSKAINIRDYSCASLMEERNTVLYYAIIVIKDYLAEKILENSDLTKLSKDLQDIIHLEKEKIIQLYHASNYTIFDEYMDNNQVSQKDWNDLFNLVQLGHYTITKQALKNAIHYYNTKYNTNLSELSEFIENSEEQYERLLNRVSYRMHL